MSSQRKRLVEIYGSRYKRITPHKVEDMYRCIYCGDMAGTIDHIPSISNIEFFDISGANLRYLLVPCCSECNSLAGDKPHETIEERSEYLSATLEKKYKKNIIAFTKKEEDISYMSDRLRASVEAFADVGRIAIDRAKFKGYSFDVDGEMYVLRNFSTNALYKVSGRKFNTATEAIALASKIYSISTEKIASSLSVDGVNSIEEAAIYSKKEQFIKAKVNEIWLKLKELKMAAPRKTVEKYVRSNFRAIPKETLEACNDFNATNKILTPQT